MNWNFWRGVHFEKLAYNAVQESSLQNLQLFTCLIVVKYTDKHGVDKHWYDRDGNHMDKWFFHVLLSYMENVKGKKTFHTLDHIDGWASIIWYFFAEWTSIEVSVLSVMVETSWLLTNHLCTLFPTFSTAYWSFLHAFRTQDHFMNG